MEHVVPGAVWLLEQLGYGVLAVGAVLALVCLTGWVESLWQAWDERRGRK